MQLRRREDIWSPMTRLRHNLNRLFDYPEFGGTELFEGWQPAVDVQEGKDNFIVKAEMQRMKREDIAVSISPEHARVMWGAETGRGEEGGRLLPFGALFRQIPALDPASTGGRLAKDRSQVSGWRAHSEAAKERAGESQTDRSESRLGARYSRARGQGAARDYNLCASSPSTG